MACPSFENIMCVIDPTSRAQPALHRAEWLAKHTSANIELFVCLYDEHLSGQRFYDSPGLEQSRQEIIENEKDKLEHYAEDLRQRGLRVSTTVSWGRPLHADIVRHAVESAADVVLKDTHSHSRLERTLFTHTDWSLIRTCPVPLWLVKPRDIQSPATIVAAIDPVHANDKPAALDNRILDVANELSNCVSGELHSCHSFDPRTALAGATANAYLPVSLPIDEIISDMRERHGKRCEEVLSDYDVAGDNQHLLCGVASEQLPELAKNVQADIFVMGAVARNRWKQLYIGSTAERVLEHLPSDLLIIKPSWNGIPADVEGIEERPGL